MKTAIYIEDGTVQLVITPETEFEKNALKAFSENPMEAKIFRGAFYDCRGGWVRQKPQYQLEAYGRCDPNEGDDSLILRMTKKEFPEVIDPGNNIPGSMP